MVSSYACNGPGVNKNLLLKKKLVVLRLNILRHFLKDKMESASESALMGTNYIVCPLSLKAIKLTPLIRSCAGGEGAAG